MMVKAAVTGPRGHMGGLIIKEIGRRSDMELSGCIGAPGRDYIGKDAGEGTGVIITDDIEKAIADADVVVDFSRPEVSMKMLDSCIAHGKAFLCGTTGFTDEQTERFVKAGERIAVMKASNTSYLVNVMKRIAGAAALYTGERCDIDVIDMHSADKADAPSGTALELAEEMAGRPEGRRIDDIVFHSVRSGGTPSAHRIIFSGMGERMEISHESYDWGCFASGACDAAVFMGRKLAEGARGVFTMEDVVFGGESTDSK